MSSCPPENQLLELIEGRISQDAMADLVTHMEECEVCRAIVASLAPSDSSGTGEQPMPLAMTGPGPGGATVPADALGVGQRVGPYRLVRRLGAGGMGVVFAAVHERIGSQAAIKILHPRFAHDRLTAERFLNEARATNLVRHPGLVNIFEMGQFPTGAAYIIMEYLDGESLGHRLKRLGSLSPGAVVPLARQIADALAATHDKGVIHRDLKPDNIMLVPDAVAPAGERAKILDFGLAKLTQAAGPLTSFTQSGAILGTPVYMAPEQCRGGGQVDAKADVYSLGVVLYHLLAGHPPFVALSIVDLLAMHLRDPPAPLGPPVPSALSDLLTAMLAKDPAARPGMREVVKRLDALSLPHPGAVPTDRPRGQTRPAGRRPATVLALLPLLLLLTAVVPWRSLRRQVPTGDASSMAHIPGGTFSMGSSPAEVDSAYHFCLDLKGAQASDCARSIFEREEPQREVTVTPFRLDVTEVTNEQFAAWLNRLPRAQEPVRDDGDPKVKCSDYASTEKHAGVRLHNRRCVEYDGILLADLYPSYSPSYGITYQAGSFKAVAGLVRKPATQLTWEAARRYCQSWGKRLPTEAEWEFAARGTEGARFPWGAEEPRCEGVMFAQLAGQACERQMTGPADVGTSSQDHTPQGVRDLGGNVSEWVMDRFHERYPPCAKSPCVDPLAEEGPASDGKRVVRGGNWEWSASTCRSASRSRFPQNWPNLNVGFRCAASVAGR